MFSGTVRASADPVDAKRLAGLPVRKALCFWDVDALDESRFRTCDVYHEPGPESLVVRVVTHHRKAGYPLFEFLVPTHGE